MYHPQEMIRASTVRRPLYGIGLLTGILTVCLILSSCSVWNSFTSPPVYEPYVTLPENNNLQPSHNARQITKGAAITDTKTGLNMLTEWSRTVKDGDDTLSMVLTLICDDLTIPNPNGIGTITIGEEIYHYSPEMDVLETDDPQFLHIILWFGSYVVPYGETVHVTVTWPWNKVYNGHEIGTLKTEFTAESPIWQE